jgi:hypothetical protein
MTTATDPRHLDDRIRALVADAVGVAPEPPELELLTPPIAPVVPLRRRVRVPIGVTVGAAAALVLVGVAVLTTRDTDRRISTAPTTPTDTPTTPTTGPTPATGWPERVGVLLVSDRGIERVTVEDGQPVVQRFFEPMRSTFGLELQDGSIVYQHAPEIGDYGVIQLVRPDGRPTAVANLATSVLVDARVVDGVVQVLFSTPAFGAPENERVLWQYSDSDGSTTQVDGTGWDVSLRPQQGGAAVLGLADGSEFALPDSERVTMIDRWDGFAAVSFEQGPGLLVDLRSGASYQLPASGTATIIRRSISNRPVEPPPTTVAERPDVPFGLLLAGPDGVWEIGPDDGAQITSQPMAIALREPDGSIVMQRQSGWGEGWTPGDTVPLVWRSGGTIEELLPGADLAADSWIRLHDIAEVDGRTWLLYEVQHTPDPRGAGAGSLVAFDLGSSATVVLDENFGDWQRPIQRFRITAAGVVVGAIDDPECVTMLAYSLPGSTAPLPTTLPLPGSCRRAITVDRSGHVLAWIEGSSLVVWWWFDGGEQQRIDLGDRVDLVSGLALGDGYAVVERPTVDGQQRPPLLVRFRGGSVDITELSALTATIG